MGAAELLDYPRENVRGLVLEEGAVTSHVVIVARAMGIPVIGQAAGAVALAENRDAVIIDGDDGQGASAAVGRTCSAPTRKRYGSAPAGRSSSARCKRCRAADQGRPADHLADECWPSGRPAAAGRNRVPRASAFSAPSCSS
ncbi:PEP-utilizing enzyme [Ensifer canadensis]